MLPVFDISDKNGVNHETRLFKFCLHQRIQQKTNDGHFHLLPNDHPIQASAEKKTWRKGS